MRKLSPAAAMSCLLVVLGAPSAGAQGRWNWWDDVFVDRRPWDWNRSPAWEDPRDRDWRRQPRMQPPRGDGNGALSNEVRDGGARPPITPQAPPVVAFHHDYPANSIVIDSGARRLYYVLPGGKAYAYTISVGREGFGWTGTETVSQKRSWPDWHPPAEMRARDPRLPQKMTGGLENPLGAMALYLGTTLYRIHGTNDPRSLGQAQSSGCFRMMNENVVHLASLAEVGTTVNVVASLGQTQSPPPESVSAPAWQAPPTRPPAYRPPSYQPSPYQQARPTPPPWRTPPYAPWDESPRWRAW